MLIRNFIYSFISFGETTDLSGKKILDLGCGEGMMMHQLSKKWPKANISGLDIRHDLLTIAKQMALNADCIAGSVYEIPLKDESYDFVICTEVLEHLHEPELALKEIMRVGKKFFLFSVPNEPWWRIANMARGAYLYDLGNTPGHLNHWRKSAFLKFISKYTTIRDVKCPFPWTMVLCAKSSR